MKKLIFFLLLLSHFSYAQWIYNKKVDPIDGLTETVIASGRGGKFPYEKPNLVIRKINNEIAMYISGMGSTACGSLKLTFSYGDPNNLMEFYLEDSVTGDAAFIPQDDIIKISSFIQLLKEKTIAYFRFSSRCSMNNFNISLTGSKSYLERILNEDFYKDVDLAIIERGKQLKRQKQREVEKAKELEREAKELKLKKEKASVISNKLYQDAVDIGLDDVSLKLLRAKLDREEIILNDDLFKYVKLEIGAMDLSSLSEKNNKISLKIVMSNGNAKLLFGSWYLKPKSKVLMEAERLRRLEKEQRDMQKDRYLSKYQNENLSEFLLETIDKIIKKSGNLKWDDIENVKIRFSNYTKSVDKFYNLTLIVTLKNSKSISEQLALSVAGLTIRMSDIKDMGGEPNKFF